MPLASLWSLGIACWLWLSFRHQTTIDRDSILSPPRPAPHKTLIARKLWRTQIAPARMSCKPPQKLLCSPKPTSIVEKNWNIYNYSGQLFHFSRSFWIVSQVKFIMIWNDKDDQHLSVVIKLFRHSENWEKETETSETMFWRAWTLSLSTKYSGLLRGVESWYDRVVRVMLCMRSAQLSSSQWLRPICASENSHNISVWGDRKWEKCPI